MQPIVFREEEEPRFNLRTASLCALLFLLLVFWLSARVPIFQLNATELKHLQETRQEQERDLVFRFVDSPPDPEKNPDARFFSDADRVKKSQAEEQIQPENDDPISQGNSFELKSKPIAPNPNQQASPPSPPLQQQAQPERLAGKPAETQEVEDQAEPTEPEEPQEQQPPKDPGEYHTIIESNDKGNLELPPGAPKPYRNITKAELQNARQKALDELKLIESKPSAASGSDAERYHNPGGSKAPNIGFSIDTAGHDLGPYLEILRQLVKGNWRIPQIARFEVSGVAVVYFKLHKDGLISDAQILVGSEYEPLDTSSINAIKNTYKAPPLPDHIQEEWIPIKFAFYYNMRPRY